jgi:hypothetical protein
VYITNWSQNRSDGHTFDGSLSKLTDKDVVSAAAPAVRTQRDLDDVGEIAICREHFTLASGCRHLVELDHFTFLSGHRLGSYPTGLAPSAAGSFPRVGRTKLRRHWHGAFSFASATRSQITTTAAGVAPAGQCSRSTSLVMLSVDPAMDDDGRMSDDYRATARPNAAGPIDSTRADECARFSSA